MGHGENSHHQLFYDCASLYDFKENVSGSERRATE